MTLSRTLATLALAAVTTTGLAQTTPDPNAARKQQLMKDVDSNAKLVQVMIDTIFSFGELGFQEFETSKYLTALLEKNGFKVDRGIDGISHRLDGHLDQRHRRPHHRARL